MTTSRRFGLAGLLLSACASKPLPELLDQVRTYQEAMRWRRYEAAAAHIVPGEREEFLSRTSQLDAELRISDYEIERVDLVRGRTGAVVQVRYEWHLDSVGIVKETVVVEDWERRDPGWILVAHWRKRGEPMPGVPDKPR